MYECIECQGKGKITVETIPIFQWCRRCGGVGKLDWIDNVIPHPKYTSNSEFKVFEENLQSLIYNLKLYASKNGYNCKIELESIYHEFDLKRMF